MITAVSKSNSAHLPVLRDPSVMTMTELQAELEYIPPIARITFHIVMGFIASICSALTYPPEMFSGKVFTDWAKTPWLQCVLILAWRLFVFCIGIYVVC
jgi:hypothetical protein